MKPKDQLKEDMLACRMTSDSKKLFEKIASKIGVKGYSLLNLLVSSVIRYSDTSHQLDPTLTRIIDMFDGFVDWGKISSICSTEKKDAVKAIYLMAESGKKGTFPIMIDQPFFGDLKMTYNVQDILSEVVRSCSPKLHNRLRDAGEQLGCNTITETIMTLVDLHAPDSDEEEIREMFADCRRAINNRDSDLIKYKQKKNRTSQLELDL